jgi:hypothetical protein
LRSDVNDKTQPRRVLRRIANLAWKSLLALLVLCLCWALYCFRDRNPGYTVEVQISPRPAMTEPRPLKAGFAREDITPVVGGARPVWLAGFSNHRAATAVHDPLKAVATVLDDGHTRLGIVVLDSIGFMHDDVAAVRKRLPPDLKLDYAIVCSTHNHSTPDLMGIWGPSFHETGVDPAYRERVIASAASALSLAARALEPARMSLLEIATPPDGLVADTRRPKVFDSDLRLMLFTNPTNRHVIGSIVGWGNHPETPWGKNTEITADFPGYLRTALEEGLVYDGAVKVPGLGGTHLFVNGAVGGLMTTHPTVTVHDPFLNEDLSKPSHEKARAVGYNLARRVLDRISVTNSPGVESTAIGIRARTIGLPLGNPAFMLAPLLRLVDRGHMKWRTVRTEIAFVTIGDASIACLPGEVYPEIVNGGIERAPGGDFDIEPLEVPPLRELMPGKVKFVFGLANDEIGYIIPKSEWDRQPPHLYGESKAPYGEINSLGPETAHLLHSALRELIQAAGQN